MRICLVKGGPSLEYDVSLKSAKTIRTTLEELGHEVEEILIPKTGKLPHALFTSRCDLFYPVMHGHMGEDGLIQALFELLDRPYVSEDVLTSSIGMDKDTQLRLFAQAGIPTARTVCLRQSDKLPDRLFDAEHYIVKMNSGGSSIGIEKADRKGLDAALARVFELDERVLIQEEISPLRELECLVFYDYSDDEVKVAGPIEVSASAPYYVYENKYSDRVRCIPPEEVLIDEEIRNKITQYAARAFRAVHGSLYMRVDFFLSGSRLMINEINTIPGSTPSSHLLVLAGQAGGMKAFVSNLIENALIRYNRKKV